MVNEKLKCRVAFVMLAFVGMAAAQTATDHLLMKKNEICFAGIYETGTWDRYWEGNNLRENANIGEFTRVAAMPMLAYGITNTINVFVLAPHINTDASSGQLVGQRGFQDLSVSVKARLIRKPMGKGRFELFTTAGYSTPLTNYLSDYQPFSIGLGADEVSGRFIGHAELDNGIFLRSSASFLWRGTTKIERDFYYADGAIYSNKMDVPNAWVLNNTIGVHFLKNALRIEANYMALRSTSGDDIRAFNAPQPTNKVNIDQLGLFTQYFLKQIKGLSITGSYSQVVNARNMGKFTSFGAGLTYQFQI